MSRGLFIRILLLLGLTACPWSVSAQPTSTQINILGYNVIAYHHERLEEKHWLLSGSVELEQGDTKLYADEVEWFEAEDSVLARGNVLVTQPTSRISADHAEFNVKTHLGTFHTAWGIANQQPRRPTVQPGGIIVPQAIGQDTDIYFFGETIEKIAAKKYKIVNGGFSTCVQPTPRWQLSADTVTLNIDHYTFLRQAIFNVKDVPMFYLPFLYYPTQEDGRATGFLLPTYSHTSIDGHSIHNAFFWAINRSMDATIFHDYLSQTGGRLGSEYRYNLGGGSDGSFLASGLDQRAGTLLQPDGTVVERAAMRTYDVRGSANQLFPGRLRGRFFIDYFSSVQTNQIYNTDFNAAFTNNRRYNGTVTGAWRSYALNASFDRAEYYSTPVNSTVTGSSPRLNITRSERPLFPNSPVYISFSGEAAHLDRSTDNAGVIDDRSVSRFDFFPQIRYPIKKWQWFTVNTSASWRDTFYTRGLDPLTQAPVDTDVNRQYVSLQAQVVGPVFTRIWDTPDSGYAEKIKHTIEPVVTIQKITSIDISRIVQIDGTDRVFGTTTITYGLNNRLYAKRRVGQISQAQEILAFEIGQSYYVDPAASQFDPRYNAGLGGAAASNNFSAIQMNARVMPSSRINGSLRSEVDSTHRSLRSISANANYNIPQRLQASLGWTRTFFVPGYNDLNQLTNNLNFSTNLQTRDNKYGLNYSGYYDVRHTQLLQQRIAAFYNAQCCGVAVEFQHFNYSAGSLFYTPSVNRFFLSFTLAGIGNFSPVGGMNGGRR